VPARLNTNGWKVPATLDQYLNLRMPAGLSPRRPDQALAALDGGWAALHVVHQPTATTVGMGRRLGDGGWYFHVLDMAVLPDHHGRGLGDPGRIADEDP